MCVLQQPGASGIAATRDASAQPAKPLASELSTGSATMKPASGLSRLFASSVCDYVIV